MNQMNLPFNVYSQKFRSYSSNNKYPSQLSNPIDTHKRRKAESHTPTSPYLATGENRHVL